MMKFTIWRASGDNSPIEGAEKGEGKQIININSLEELMALKKRLGSDLILGDTMFGDADGDILIYDDYVE